MTNPQSAPKRRLPSNTAGLRTPALVRVSSRSRAKTGRALPAPYFSQPNVADSGRICFGAASVSSPGARGSSSESGTCIALGTWSAMNHTEPLLQFHRLIEQVRAPQRADRAAAGTLPTRAYRYCDAVTSAAGYGWWVFPPLDLRLIWDGHEVFWHCDATPDWMPLSPAAQFPNFSHAFDEIAPERLRGCAPPFLTALPEPGVVQIWTGLMARTAEGWSLLIRAPANLAAPAGYSLYEGIVETDRWFGPLFTNLRLTQTHKPIHLGADFPLLQVQPLPRQAYAEHTLSATSIVPNMFGMSEQDWNAYENSIVVPNQSPGRAFGGYAVAARKRRRGDCPFRSARADG
jgi:Family of unknown function (DUF6065)